MGKTFSLSRLMLAAAMFAGLGFLLWLRLHQPPNTVDDAYITFRYARNIANGVGFVYNAGERVLGTTTPAYALLLAGFSKISGIYDYPWLALIVNALWDAISFCLLARLAKRLTGHRLAALGAAWLFAIDGRVLDFGTGGMEGSFNVVAIVLTLVLFFENHMLWAALAAGLAVLIRPDGAMLAAAIFFALGLDGLRRKASFPWKPAVVFLAVVAPWLIFATLYFGQPIPQSVLAKSVVYRLPALMAFRAFLVQLRTIFPFSLPPLEDVQSLERQIAQAALPAVLCGLGIVAAQRRRLRAWVMGAYLVLFIAFFSVGNPLWLGWYEVPLMPLYQILVLAAVVWLGKQLARLPLSRRVLSPGEGAGGWGPMTAALVLCGFGLMAVPQLSRLNLIPWETPRNPPFVLNATYNKLRESDYKLFAQMLQPAADNHRRVAIPEIGAFGYYYYDSMAYPGNVFDVTGLTSPAVLKYFPVPVDIPIEIYSVPRPAVLELRPDIFVTFDSFIQATLPPDDPEFTALYRPVLGLTSHAAFGIQRLVAYRRVDLPVEVTTPPGLTPADVHYDQDVFRLTGYTTRFWADQENNFLEVALFWKNGSVAPQRDLLVRVNLLSADGQRVYEVLDQPGEKLFPSQSWAPGMLVVDRHQLKRPRPEAGPYTVTVTLFDSAAEGSLLARTAAGAELPENTFVIRVP